jgi:hypothetical protein
MRVCSIADKRYLLNFRTNYLLLSHYKKLYLEHLYLFCSKL